MKFRRIFKIVFLFPVLIFSQKGKDGAANISVANTTVNSYYVVTADALAGSNSVAVSSNAGLAVGDLVMIIQMQGALVNAGKDSIFPDFNSSIPTNTTHGAITNYNNSGNYELHQISQLPNNTTVIFDCSLQKNYLHLAKVQLVKIPRYSSLIVSAPGNIVPAAWNGTTGGVVAIEVSGNATLNAMPSIDASGRGFRGGWRITFNLPGIYGGNKWGSLLYNEGGMKGESIAGDTTRYKVYSSMYGRGAMANGGGGGCTHNAGGGGGANGGLLSIYSGSGIPVSGYNNAWNLESPGFASHVSSGGGRGGYSFSSNNQNPNTTAPGNTSWGGDNRRIVGGLGGRPLDYSVERLFAGGGGGAGHGNNSQASSGGNGGGIVFLIIDGNLTGSGTILSNGSNAPNTTTGCSENDGAGGGGGGGCIVLKIGGTVSMTAATPISARGGNGGNVQFNCFISNSQSYGPGAGGGGGFVGSNIPLAITIDLSGGSNGVVTGNNNSIQQNFPPNGATQGGAGSSAFTLSPLPVISYTNATVCVGSSATLTATASTNNIFWYNTITGGTAIASGTLYNTPIFSSPGTYSFYAGSCPGIYRQLVTVSVAPSPTISVNSPTICNGQTATLTAGGAVSYTWSNSSNNTSVVVSPTATSQFTVSGTNAQGCLASAVSTVNVNAGPSLTVNTAQICPGQTATLTASGASTYTWNTSSNNASITVTPSVSTQYTVIGSALGCTSQAVTQVTVNPNPTITVNSPTICIGNSATLTAGGANTYTWSTSSNNSSIAVSPTTTTQYTVTGTSAQGCSASAISTVNVNAGPSLTVSNLQICSGKSGTLFASGALSYTWNTSSNSPSIVVNPTINTTYTVIGSNGTCTSQAIRQVTVHPLPTITVNSPTVCSGQSATLLASGASTYTWSTSSTGNSIVLSPTVQSIITVTGTSSNGCNAATSSTVFVLPQPTLSLNANQFNLCGSQQATIIASSNYTNFVWSNASTSSSIVVSTAGVYQVTVNSVCGSSVQSATVTTGSAPVLTIVPSSSFLCAGQNVTLTTAGSTGTFVWSNASNASSIVVNQTGVYSVTLTNACGSVTQQISLNDGPSTSLNLSTTSNSICAGDQATLTAIGNGSINWSTGAMNTNSIVINTPSVYSATLSNICGTSIQQITVSPVAPPDIQISASPSAICSGGSSTLIAFGIAPASYSWTGISSQPSIVINATGIYSAVAFNNCGTSLATIQIVPQPQASLSVSATTTVLCPGEQTTITANGVNGNNTYTWSSSPTNTTNQLIIGTPGVYTVTYGNQCGSVSETIQIILSNVQASFSLSPNSGMPPLTVNFTNTSVNYISNSWDFGNGNFSPAANPSSQNYTQPGIYTITLVVSDNNGCTSIVTQTIEVLDIPFGPIPQLVSPDGDGKNDFFEIKGISKFPNNELEIYNRWGNLVYKKQGYMNEWDGRPNVNGSMGKNLLPSATYFYILKLGDSNNTTYKGFLHLVH
jgi:gliding motility-associated-like protein